MSTLSPPLPTSSLDPIAEGVNPSLSNPNDLNGGMLNRVVGGAHEAIDHLAEQVAPQVQRVQDGLASANEMLHQRGTQARELGEAWSERFNGSVREHPLTALATAFALGMLITRLAR